MRTSPSTRPPAPYLPMTEATGQELCRTFRELNGTLREFLDRTDPGDPLTLEGLSKALSINRAELDRIIGALGIRKSVGRGRGNKTSVSPEDARRIVQHVRG